MWLLLPERAVIFVVVCLLLSERARKRSPVRSSVHAFLRMHACITHFHAERWQHARSFFEFQRKRRKSAKNDLAAGELRRPNLIKVWLFLVLNPWLETWEAWVFFVFLNHISLWMRMPKTSSLKKAWCSGSRFRLLLFVIVIWSCVIKPKSLVDKMKTILYRRLWILLVSANLTARIRIGFPWESLRSFLSSWRISATLPYGSNISDISLNDWRICMSSRRSSSSSDFICLLTLVYCMVELLYWLISQIKAIFCESWI